MGPHRRRARRQNEKEERAPVTSNFREFAGADTIESASNSNVKNDAVKCEECQDTPSCESFATAHSQLGVGTDNSSVGSKGASGGDARVTEVAMNKKIKPDNNASSDDGYIHVDQSPDLGTECNGRKKKKKKKWWQLS